MKTKFIILAITLIILNSVTALNLSAQDIKANSAVSQPYPNLGVDMQYYEIRYDPNNEDHVSYYKAVREKIMQKLKNLYKYHYENGDVHLSFILKSDGKLENFYVDRIKSTQDNLLIDIATSSLKRSSPFPSFPKGMTSPEISFSVIISFREKAGS